MPHLTSARKTIVLDLPTPEGWKAELTIGGRLHTTMTHPETVTHLSINRARRRITTSIKNAKPGHGDLPIICQNTCFTVLRVLNQVLIFPAESVQLTVYVDTADEELFSKAVKQSHHVLHTLLPPPSTASQNYNLRHRTHSLELPAHTTHLTDCAFITRMLYKDVY